LSSPRRQYLVSNSSLVSDRYGILKEKKKIRARSLVTRDAERRKKGSPTFNIIVLDRCAAVGGFLHLRAIALLRDDASTWSAQSVSVN